MSDNEIQISFTEQEVHDMVHGGTFPREIRAKFEAALSPEYVRGTLYRVRCLGDEPFTDPAEGFWDGAAFVLPTPPLSTQSIAGYRRVSPEDVTHVQPLRVLGDDELAVKVDAKEISTTGLRQAADYIRGRHCYHATPLLIESVADAVDALDAETKP